MATADSVKAKIQSVITKANSTTGNADSDLTSAVNSLISGYAQDSDYQLQSKTVSPSTSVQNITPDSGYYGLSQVKVNAMATATQATPSISVSSAGLITASATQTAGYVAAGTKSATKQLTTQAAKTVTPTTSNQTAVSSGVYTTGAVTVAGDSNLVAGNIKSGVSIFGVTGTHSGGITPTGTINITTNGSHNVTNYATANVNVPVGEDVTAETNAYTSLLTELENAIDDLPTGGGGALDTCEVSVTSTVTANIAYTTVDSNGKPQGAYISNASSARLQNVICGSSVCLFKYSSNLPVTTSSTKAEVMYVGGTNGCVFKVTAGKGEVATIELSNAGGGGSN